MIQVPGEFYCPFSGKKPPLSAKNLDLNCKSACHLVYSLQLLLNVVSSTSKASFWAAPAGIAEQEGALTVQRGAGCDFCRRKGYLGRTGIFELLQVDEDLRSLIGRRSEPRELIERARANGIYRSLLEDGIDKVKQGLTTPEEIRRVTMI